MLENQIVFGVDGMWLTTRRIDGQFPNFRQLLPETFEHEVRAARSELLDVVKRRVGHGRAQQLLCGFALRRAS